MQRINLDEKWYFRRGMLDSVGMLQRDPGELVNLPHDGMIHLDVTKEAPAQYDSGYYPGDTCNYTRYVMIPREWEKDLVGLQFDGVMMHTSIDVNGCKVGEHHYGYSPFYVDLTDYVTFGEENRITINVNTGVQPSSRWYTGSGLFRGVTLCHSPRVFILPDGINVVTREVTDQIAFLEAQVEIGNETLENHMVEVKVELRKEGEPEKKAVAEARRMIEVRKNDRETARISIHLSDPVLWDAENPNLYIVKATVTDQSVFRTHSNPVPVQTVDEAQTLFGIRTITVDSVRGLRINGKPVKLKGGCVHHDNGLLGAVSLYECEERKVRKLKETGFNAIRTAHNPPSRVLVEACDRLGMYIFDEAFDAWGMAKRTGDYSQYFETWWEKDLTAFVKRDRVHPSVIMWSTGNEIPERGGLNQGYSTATKLAECIRTLDPTRPVSNGICSFWSGLDDAMAKGQDQTQNAATEKEADFWEKQTEAFTNGLDVVGYNYMEDLYERDHELYPERVILGSENFPREIGFRWPVVEKLPYVIGDFTWTAWDYIGEAGIGKSLFVDETDPLVKKGPWAVMPPSTTCYPWRLANDADFDITGIRKPQGDYRSVVWGSEKTYLYSMQPQNYGKAEVISMWGVTDVRKCWNYAGFEGKPVEVIAFSGAEEVELLLNGVSVGKKEVQKDGNLPNSVRFVLPYEKGVLEAVSYTDGMEVSRDRLATTGEPAEIRLIPEKKELRADGHDVVFVQIEILDQNGLLVTDAQIPLKAVLSGVGELSGFGSANPVTEDNYTQPETYSFRGRATAVIRSGYEQGSAELVIENAQLGSFRTRVPVHGTGLPGLSSLYGGAKCRI